MPLAGHVRPCWGLGLVCPELQEAGLGSDAVSGEFPITAWCPSNLIGGVTNWQLLLMVDEAVTYLYLNTQCFASDFVLSASHVLTRLLFNDDAVKEAVIITPVLQMRR